jgi:hypothetical protein
MRKLFFLAVLLTSALSHAQCPASAEATLRAMHGVSEEFTAADIKLQEKQKVEILAARAKSMDDESATVKTHASQFQDLQKQFVPKVQPVMAAANTLRVLLSRQGNLAPTMPKDTKYATIFSKAAAGTPISWSEMHGAYIYLRDLTAKQCDLGVK